MLSAHPDRRTRPGSSLPSFVLPGALPAFLARTVPVAGALVAAALVAGALLSLAPSNLVAQDRPVAFNEVSVSSQGAAITLEFEDGERLAMELREGALRIDGTRVASYTPGDALDRAWRELLGQAISVDNGGVARLLAGWRAPGGLSGDAAEAARILESRIRGALTAAPATTTAVPGAAGAVADALDPGAQRSLLELIVRSPERAGQIARVLESREPRALEIRIGETVRIAEGERLDASLLLVDGALELEGRIAGDLLLVGGSANLGDDARVEGDLRQVASTLTGNVGGVTGEVVEVDAGAAPTPVPSPSDLRAEIEREIREGIREGMRETGTQGPSRRSTPSFFRNLVSGVGGVLQAMVTFALLLGIGVAVLYFFPRPFEVVARTAAHVPGRSFAVGWAGTLLSPFAWIAGMVLLAATIIGIPVMLLWIPLFWVILAAAFLVGFLAVCRNLGTWWVRRGDTYHPQGIDTEQPAARLGVGLALVLAIFVVASVLEIGGSLFRIFQVALVASGSVVAVNLAVVGFGAVLLSRGGRDRRWVGNSAGLGGLDDLDMDDATMHGDPFTPRGRRPRPEPGPYADPGTHPHATPEAGPFAGPGTRAHPGSEASPDGNPGARPHSRPGSGPASAPEGDADPGVAPHGHPGPGPRPGPAPGAGTGTGPIPGEEPPLDPEGTP